LLRLGAYHKATVHIDGINGGPNAWLDLTLHQHSVNSSWDHYFDTRANGGEPFHEVTDFHGCLDLYRAKRQFWTSEKNDHQCVNVHADLYTFFYQPKPATAPYRDEKIFYPGENHHIHGPALKYSRAVDAATRRVLSTTRNEPYGFIHIRLCDREQQNSVCTEPPRVSAFVSQHPGVKTRFVFWYASHGYRERLESKLHEVVPRTSVIFEEACDFDNADKNDNYFKSLVMLNIKAGSKVNYDTHACSGATPVQVRRDFGEPSRSEIEDTYFASSRGTSESDVQGVCR